MNSPIILPKSLRKPHMRSNLAIGFFTILLIGYTIFISYRYSQMPLYSPSSSDSLIYCEGVTFTGSHFDWDCIKRGVRIILETQSTADFMDSLTNPHSLEGISGNCHSIAHFIGMETFRTSTSIEDAMMKCTNSCGSGCIHGIIAGAVLKDLGETYSSEDIEHADIATIRKIGKKYCKSSDPMCHAMGHILSMSDPSYTGALDSCETIADSGSTRESCYQGVFMQSVGGEKEGLFSGKGMRKKSVDDYAYPCSLVDPAQLHACFHYLPLLQSELFQANNIRSLVERYKISEHVCESFSLSGRSDCFLGIGFFVNNEVFPEDFPIDIPARCATLGIGSDQNSCDRGIMDQYMYRKEYTQMLSYCHILSNAPRKISCYDSIFESIESGAPQADIEAICTLGEMTECREQYHRYQKPSS